MDKKIKVTFRTSEPLYVEYKKAMLDARRTPTSDLNAYIKKVVENYHAKNSGKVVE